MAVAVEEATHGLSRVVGAGDPFDCTGLGRLIRTEDARGPYGPREDGPPGMHWAGTCCKASRPAVLRTSRPYDARPVRNLAFSAVAAHSSHVAFSQEEAATGGRKSAKQPARDRNLEKREADVVCAPEVRQTPSAGLPPRARRRVDVASSSTARRP